MDFDRAIEQDPSFATAQQVALRASLGLDSAEIDDLLKRSEFVSLGGFCGVAQALGSLGLRKSAGPFDWLRSPADGVLQCLQTDFCEFLSCKGAHVEGGHQVFETSWGGSFWHHDISAESTKDAFLRRIERYFRGEQATSSAPRFFIRVANSSEELRLSAQLLETLQKVFSRAPVYLLVIVDMQKMDSMVQVSGASNHLLFHRVHEDLWLNSIPDARAQMERCAQKYAACIGAAVRHWAKQEIVPTQDAAANIYFEGWMDTYNGGDPARKGYSPQGEPPGYMRVPEGKKPGDVISAQAFGRIFPVSIPDGAQTGCVLELRLTGDALSVRLVPDNVATAALALMGITSAAAVAATTSGNLPAGTSVPPTPRQRTITAI